MLSNFSKIYAVGLYVPKRDVLADSNFAPFAGMGVQELRKNDAFYHHLMQEGAVDKTLFIKLNMQLATETVRQSLSAEWQLLSDEHKNQLAQSSATPREAEPAMLEKIKSEENTSNCSCGQTAPPEYEADESCCARGTEMVFTWRKNGNLEVRGRTSFCRAVFFFKSFLNLSSFLPSCVLMDALWMSSKIQLLARESSTNTFAATTL